MSDLPSDPTREGLLKTPEMRPIKTARIIIMVMAVLHLLAGTGLWLVASWVASAIDAPQASAISPEEATEAPAKSAPKAGDEARERELQEARKAAGDVHVIAGIALAVGMTFFAFFFWARTNPFGATLAALIIWLVGQAADFSAAPGEYHHGLLIRIFILCVLAKGVHSGWRYLQQTREAEAQG
jgi:hypothetical protein